MHSSFNLNLRSHCRIIKWPNFNIVESHGIGRPEEGEKDGGMAGSEAVRRHVTFIN